MDIFANMLLVFAEISDRDRNKIDNINNVGCNKNLQVVMLFSMTELLVCYPLIRYLILYDIYRRCTIYT